jgi:hypothetical protein
MKQITLTNKHEGTTIYVNIDSIDSYYDSRYGGALIALKGRRAEHVSEDANEIYRKIQNAK